MSLEENKRLLIRTYPEFAAHTSQDTDKNGNSFFELVMPNKQNPGFPLTVTVNERGCLLSWGAVDFIAGECEIQADEMCGIISDILSDQVLLVSVYPNEDALDEHRATLCDVCEKDGIKHRDFLKIAEKPLSLWGKLMSKWQGIIEFTDWSGKNYSLYKRFFGKKT